MKKFERQTKLSPGNTMLRILLSGSIFLSAPVAACPAFMDAGELRTKPDASRDQMYLFALEGDDKSQRWVNLPLQIDPMTEERVLKMEKEGVNQATAKLDPLDRISFRVEGFGRRLAESDKAPCATDSAIEIMDPNRPDRFAYLTACSIRPENFTSWSMPITHMPEKLHIKSSRFQYDYQPNNQLMYKDLIAFDPKTGQKVKAGGNADLLMHLDIKKFFTVDFTNEDVESYVEHSVNGEVGLVTRIDFYLKLLFFKINLKMATSASFFNDSAHIPMLIDAPVHSKKRLHPGSGIAYNWLPQDAKILHNSSEMPSATPKDILKGWEHLAAIGKPFCKSGDLCTFRLNGKVGSEQFRMELIVPKLLVENGFFPMFVPNVHDFLKEMDWDDEPDAKHKQEIAIYFDNSGVPKGKHRLDQWIRVGNLENAGDLTCPHPVRQRRVVDFNTKTPDNVSH